MAFGPWAVTKQGKECCRLDHIFSTFRTAAGRLRRMDVILVSGSQGTCRPFGWAMHTLLCLPPAAMLEAAAPTCAVQSCGGGSAARLPDRCHALPLCVQVTPDQLPYALIGWIGEWLEGGVPIRLPCRCFKRHATQSACSS